MSLLLLMLSLLQIVAIKGANETLPVCRNNRHIRGSWKINPELSKGKKSFQCCGFDSSDFLWNTKVCGSEAQNIRVPYSSGNVTFHVGDDACRCDSVDGTRTTVSKRETYEWIPDNCRLLEWNATQFCELLGDRKLIIYGDSIAIQIGSTMSALILQQGGKCGSQLVLAKDQHMKLDSVLYAYPTKSIVMINFGAHCAVENDAYFHDRWAALGCTLAADAHKENHTFVWWTNSGGGHLLCGASKEPLVNYQLWGLTKDSYHWFKFQMLDSLSKTYAASYDLPVMDLSPLYLRPDAHVFMKRIPDCFHYCLPGPLNIFANILLTRMFVGEL